MTTFQDIIKTLVLKSDEFTAVHARIALDAIMKRQATSAQVAAFLVALKLNNKEYVPEIIAACSESLHNFALEIDFSLYNGLHDSLIDVVGTGGDGMDTFNVSTTAAIVIAGAGCKVAKFGNRAASSRCGSADILEKIGCKLTNVTPSNVPHIINSTNFCFLFAQTFNPAVKHVADTRREIGIPTIFNLLGPLSNPARPKRVVMGIHSKFLGKLMADVLALKGVKEAMVVHGDIGLDEIKEYVVTPSDFGLPSHPISAVKGGTPTDNAELLIRLLSNEYEGPILDFVLLNSSAALVVSGLAKDFKDGVRVARESILSGRAKNALEEFKRQIKD
ncbi:15411_t:CDS:2 [Cetraspora pellucida]|uniref:Anthranilate phosphoribosyltransferase n=1 Tax=Cetraspora pellucida TaxID=1433469 RepID=A0A9N9A132_9GLOM|nr:15411_t:CDS:2 [Cetraspora pellucida]